MGRLEEHEAFLRAIFDAPADDTPRLVYADFLEENGEPDRAELIRVQCELDRLINNGEDHGERVDRLRNREGDLFQRAFSPDRNVWSISRGFGVEDDNTGLVVSAEELSDPVALRERVVTHHPTWFGDRRLWVRPGRLLGPEQVETLFGLPFVQQVTEWNLGGHVDEEPAGAETEDAGTFALIDMNVQPVITVEGVMALARNRGARKIETLILTYNNLDNDAARALADSPHLIRLKRLDFRDGNSFNGRTWTRLRDKYGENVVG